MSRQSHASSSSLGNFVFLAALAVGTSGCTTQLNTTYSPRVSSEPLVGVSYLMPVVRYEFTVTHRLVTCDSTDLPTIKTSVEYQPTTLGGTLVQLDYSRLASAFKTSDFSFEPYENGTLKSVNLEVEDHSVEVAAKVLKAGLSLAKIVGSGGVVDLAASKDSAPPPMYCTKEAAEKTRELGGLVSELKKLTKQASALADNISRLGALAALGALTEQNKVELDNLDIEHRQIVATIEAINVRVDELKKALSLVFVKQWTPPDDKASTTAPHFNVWIEPSDDALNAWAAKLFSSNSPALVSKISKEGLTVSVELIADKGVVAMPLGGTHNGLLARTPGKGSMYICLKSAIHCSAMKAGDRLGEDRVNIPQLGFFQTLPFRNGPGQNNKLQVSFRPDGAIEKLGHTKSAPALEISDGVADATDQVENYDKNNRAARQAAKDKGNSAAIAALAKPAADLDREIALREKQIKLAELNRQLAGGASADSQELVQLQAQIALLEAQIKLSELRARTTPQ